MKRKYDRAREQEIAAFICSIIAIAIPVVLFVTVVTGWLFLAHVEVFLMLALIVVAPFS